MKIFIPAASGRGITKFSPSDQVLPYPLNPRSKLRGILLRRIKIDKLFFKENKILRGVALFLRLKY
ncbi:MAG: hypothetical protein SVR81_01365 [Chloroflexota bacterium]|nr:hypothetical protein [Chloroflexota bacterium]